MSIPRLLLGLVLVSAALLAAAAVIPAPPGATASPHPVYPTLLVGGDGASSPLLLAIGWAFGVVQVVFFGACFVLGLQRAGRLGPLARPLGSGTALYAALWTALVFSYAATAGDPGARLWGAFPAPTAWMLYALWPFPLWFVVLYFIHFDDWFLNERDLERFRSRLAELERDAASAPTSAAANAAIAASLVINLGIELLGVRLPWGIHGGVVAMLASLGPFLGISLVQSPPTLAPDIEAALDV